MNRRAFLASMLGLGVSVYWPQISSASEQPATAVMVPPSLMLHSRHWRIFPELLRQLREVGYQGITYQEWEHNSVPENPILISIDDLSLTAGNPAFEYFERMNQEAAAQSMNVTFGIITRPDEAQDDARWNTLREWIDQGMEMATHTAFHSNLDNPRFTALDYEAEIIDSAAMIYERTGQPVLTLITPFGSGYDILTQHVNPGVLDAAQAAHLRYVVGITTGLRHVHGLLQAGDIIYAGRANPSDEFTINDSLYYLQYW
jgi:hypothetical protein